MNCPTVKNPENSQTSHFVDRNGYPTDDVGIVRNALKSVGIWKFRNRQQIISNEIYIKIRFALFDYSN
jgi:hypothetical protein